ncbi:N-6 DNA methylase [Sorangium sp. So ce375]|uniref:N-6 DNA methylase n=1 Tax=Sorangium sp. So ce375 TaxID=3133306 RepID=UPI003F5B42DC
MSDEILTVQEVAALLKVADKTVNTMAQKGQIPTFKVRGQSRFRRADIDAWIRSRRPRAVRREVTSSQSSLPLPVTLAELESHLWEAANILRGSPVDRTDWKSYILPLLFFKRICDVWDEEHAAMLAEYGEDFADEHRFQVPEGCHWSAVRRVPKNVGSALANAMRGVEAANQKHLYGVFGDAQWTNKDRLPDELLKDLIEHFSALSLGNARVASDVMGDAYEYLIKQFADATNKKAGEFYTPRSVVRLVVDILDPEEGETIYDPACGTGGMLLAAVEHVRERGGDPRTFFGRLHGQEKNLTTASVARMNLFLHGIEDFVIERGDTLRNPVFTDASTGGLATFDVVIANPPFSLEQWGRDVWETDPWGRAFAGLPADSNADMAWVQHMVKSMAPKTGRMAVVLPQGALFRGGVEAQIRKHLLEKDLVEAVIGLAPNLFYGTSLAACVLVLRLRKAKRKKGKVLIVDASSVFRRGRAQNFMDPTHVTEIHSWVQGFADVQHRARVVDLSDIEKEGWTLNISRYVLPPIEADIPPLPLAVAAFKEALAKCREAEDNLRRVMREGGWLS